MVARYNLIFPSSVFLSFRLVVTNVSFVIDCKMTVLQDLVYDFVDAKGMDIFKTPDGIIIENELQELWITLTPDSIAQNSAQQNDCISTMWRLFGITVRQNYPRGEEVMDDSAFPDILLGSLQAATPKFALAVYKQYFSFRR